MWTWFLTLFRTASKLRELERRFSEIEEEWEITQNALIRRENRERKRKSRELAAVTRDDEDSGSDGTIESGPPVDKAALRAKLAAHIRGGSLGRTRSASGD